MINFNGTIILNGVVDRELELIWSFKSKHGNKLSFTPNVMQVVNRAEGPLYNNVQFGYNDLHGFNLVAEIVNDLHKQESKAA